MRRQDLTPPRDPFHRHRPATRTPGRSRVSRRNRKPSVSFFLVFATYLIIASLMGVGTAFVLHNRADPSTLSQTSSVAVNTTTTPKYLVLMVLDGGRPDYFGLTSLPHVDALRANGTQFTNAVDAILEAETPAGHATIATGSRPDRNGILGFDWANDNDRYSIFNPNQMGNVEAILQDSGAATLGSLYKQKYPSAKVVALSGHKYYAAAPLGGPDADAIMYYQGDPKGRYVPVAVPGHVPPEGVLDAPGVIAPTIHLADGVEDNLATKLALAAISKMQPRLLLINYPEFDWPLGHVDGGNLDRAKVITDMQGFDADLGQIEDAYQKAGILDQTLFVITADHGMMPITRTVPSSVVTNAVSQAGTTAPDIASNSGDYIWLADSSKAQAVAQNVMNAHDPGIQSAYYLTTVNGKPQYVSGDSSSVDAATEAANQYLLAALLNGHEPSVVVFAREGATFSDPSYKWKADHGGNSWQSQHIPLILSGPGIRSGVVSTAAVQLEDVAPTALADMGVTPTGMDGNVVTEALQNPSATDQQARATEVQWLTPVVNALIAQSKADSSSSP